MAAAVVIGGYGSGWCHANARWYGSCVSIHSLAASAPGPSWLHAQHPDVWPSRSAASRKADSRVLYVR